MEDQSQPKPSMESVAAKSMQNEVYRATRKFEAEFDFGKMKTMIHRFPAALGDGMPSMVAPKFVSIGPYHHGKTKQFEKMEDVKNASVYYLCQRLRVNKPETALKALLADDAAVVDEALSKYHDIAVVDDDGDVVEGEGEEGGMGSTTMKKTYFAAMMLRDACFLLLFMDAHSRFYGDKEDYMLNKSMQGFLFTHRDSISNDILLLENQLPWLVIQFVLGLATQNQIKDQLLEAVGKFVASMGNSFKILESSDDLVEYKWDDDNKPPAHLLDLLRRHKIEIIPPAADKTGHNSETTTESSSVVANRNNTSSVVVQVNDDGNSSNHHHLHRPLIDAPKEEEKTQLAAAAITSLSSMSPMDLEEIGIKLTVSRTPAFSDMGLDQGHLLSQLTLAPLSLSDTRKSCLVNMAALEVCTAAKFGEHADKTAVCSYLALLAFFMVGPDDVRRLRSMGLLHGPHGDGDMLAFFNAVVRHLPDSGKRFALVMAEIAEYRTTRRVRTTVYRWVYRYWKTIFAVLSTVAALIGFYKAFVSLIPTN